MEIGSIVKHLPTGKIGKLVSFTTSGQYKAVYVKVGGTQEKWLLSHPVIGTPLVVETTIVPTTTKEFGHDEVALPISNSPLSAAVSLEIYDAAFSACFPKNTISADKSPTLALLRPGLVNQSDCIKSAAPTVNQVWMRAVELVGAATNKVCESVAFKGTDHAYRFVKDSGEEVIVWFRTARPNNSQIKEWKKIATEFTEKYPNAKIVVSPIDHAKFVDIGNLFTHNVTDTWQIISGVPDAYWHVWSILKTASAAFHQEKGATVAA